MFCFAILVVYWPKGGFGQQVVVHDIVKFLARMSLEICQDDVIGIVAGGELTKKLLTGLFCLSHSSCIILKKCLLPLLDWRITIRILIPSIL